VDSTEFMFEDAESWWWWRHKPLGAESVTSQYPDFCNFKLVMFYGELSHLTENGFHFHNLVFMLNLFLKKKIIPKNVRAHSAHSVRLLLFSFYMSIYMNTN